MFVVRWHAARSSSSRRDSGIDTVTQRSGITWVNGRQARLLYAKESARTTSAPLRRRFLAGLCPRAVSFSLGGRGSVASRDSSAAPPWSRGATTARATDPFPTLAKGGARGGGCRNSSGSTVGATPRARYPWPEQMARKMLRFVEKRGVHATLKVTKRCALDDRCHPTFRHFHAAIQGALGAMSTKHFRQLASLTAPILQQSDDANSLPRKA